MGLNVLGEKMSDENVTKQESVQKDVKIIRVNPDNIRPVLVNDLLVSHTENEFYLTFSNIEPLGILEDSDLESIDKIEAIARAKIVITPKFAESFIRTFTNNYESYKEKLK